MDSSCKVGNPAEIRMDSSCKEGNLAEIRMDLSCKVGNPAEIRMDYMLSTHVRGTLLYSILNETT